MKVLHVISGLFFGGGHRSTLNLVEMIPRVSDVEVEFCTLGESDSEPLNARRDHSVPYCGRYNDPRVLMRTARQLSALLKQGDWDILHTHGLDADLIGAIAVCGRDSQHVCHLRITPPLGRRESWKALVRRKLLGTMTTRNDSWYIAVSEAVRVEMAAYYGFPLDRIVTVRNGIDLDVFLRDDVDRATRRGPIVIASAGRLVPMKGFEYLIDAAGELSAQGIDFELRISGTGTLLSELQRRAAACGVADRVTFYGHVTDMRNFYEHVDLFVLPSVSTEGLPLTVLEAMASGLPVISTPVGGTAEALRDGVDGLLVPPENSNQLCSAMRQLVDSQELRLQMGTSGRERVQSAFSRDRVAKEVVEVYRRMTNAKPAVKVAG